MPDELLADLGHSVTWWLEKASTHTDPHELIFFDFVGRMLAMTLDEESDQNEAERPVTRAINHPIGHITQALLNRWLKEKPNDNEGLAAAIEPYFTGLCDRNVVQYRHGRVLLAAHLITLFRVDRLWTEANLLPLLDWQADAAEARAAWEGFLWSPRVYAPLMDAFKPHFLITAQHYSDLGEHSRQFAAFLTYAALYRTDAYTAQEYQAAIQALPKEGLAEAAETLQQALESAGERQEDYWRTRVQPFWKHVWPKSRDLASSGIAESLARLSIAAGGEFPAALQAVLSWLCPIEHPEYVVHRLHESGLCGRYPSEALQLLDALIDNQRWTPRDLGGCLDDIAKASTPLERNPAYKRLRDYWRQRVV